MSVRKEVVSKENAKVKVREAPKKYSKLFKKIYFYKTHLNN